MTKKMVHVDVVSDVMCPWCYIGQKNLEAAVAASKEVDVTISWRPYQLDNTLPKEGKDRATYLNEKFGGEDRAKEIYARVEEAGRNAGIDFKFNDIAVSPNTLDAHRLIRWAGGVGHETQNALVKRLFEMFFIEGRNIGDNSVLIEAASDVGMDTEIVADLLTKENDKEQVVAEVGMAHQAGITGVPCFIIDNKFAVMGAQPPDALANAISQAAEDNGSSAI